MAGAPIPECIVGAGDNCQPVQLVVLCDDNGPFLRRYIVNCDTGIVIGVIDTTLDGITAYVPVGTVESCGEESNLPIDNCPGTLTCGLVEAQPAHVIDTTANAVNLTVSNLGGGVYNVILDDPLPTDLWSDPLGLPNNLDGYLADCLNFTPGPNRTPEWSFTIAGTPYTLQFVEDSLFPNSFAASGNGIVIDFNFDTTVVTGCVGVDAAIAAQVAVYAAIIAQVGDGVLTTVTNVSPGLCFNQGLVADPGDPALRVVVCGQESVIRRVLCDDSTAPPTPFVRSEIVDENGTTIGSIDTELDGVTPYVLVGNIVLCDSSCGLLRVTNICDLGVDPQVQFQRTEILDCSGVVILTIDEFSPGVPYVFVGPLDFQCDCLECDDGLNQFREHFEGTFTWVRPVNVHMVTVKCRAVGVVGSVTIADEAANVTPMFVGDEETWLGETEPLVGNFQVDGTDVGDIVTILYTQEIP